MSLRILVIGGGRVGAALARLLAPAHTVRLLEVRADRVDTLQDELPDVEVLSGSGTDGGTLERAGIRDTDVLAAVTRTDEVNLVAASLARFEFGVPRTVCRIVDPRNTWMYTEEMGVDVAVNQVNLIAHLVAEEMSLGAMTTLVKLRRGQYALVEERVEETAPAAHRRVADLALPRGCVLVAVLRGNDLVAVHGDVVLEPDDEVLAVVHDEDAPALAALLGRRGDRVRPDAEGSGLGR